MTKNKKFRSLFLVLIILSLMFLSVSSVLAAQHQFEIDLTINKVGSVIPKEGVATVRGKVTCPKPAYVSLSGELERRIGRVYVRGSFYKSFMCNGKTPWSAVVTSQNGLFVGGKAQASVYAYAYTVSEYDYDAAQKTIRLKGSPPPKPYYSALVETPKASSITLTFGLLSLGLIAGLVLVVSPQGGWKRNRKD